MENFSYHVPFYVVTNGVATSGYTSELAGGQVGLFDRQTWAVSTATGNGKELFFAQGQIGGKGWYGDSVTESHKSPFFKVKDVTNIYKSVPHKIQNEEWILGYDGSAGSKSLEYVKGEATRIKLYFHGEPVYRIFNAPKEFLISYTPPTDCTNDCATDCGGERQDPKPHAIKQINMINSHVELRKLGVRAKLVEDTFVAATGTREKYTLTVMDDGSGLALAKIQKLVNDPTKKVVLLSHTGIISVYQIAQPVADGAPASFVYDGVGLSQAICGACPSGWTSVAAEDTYFIKRQIQPADDFTTDNTKDTYADTVGAAYGVTVDAKKIFIGVNGSQAIIQIQVVGGTSIVAIGSDVVELIKTVGITCQSPVGSTVAWVLGATCVSGSRTLKIKLKRPECDVNGNREADIVAALAGVKGVIAANVGDVTTIAGVACIDEYTVVQNSQDCLDEDCLTSEVSFTYDEELPAIDGQYWDVVEAVSTPNAARKVGIRISAGYFDPKFGNCSFDPYDYYEVMPIKMEVSLFKEDLSSCNFGGLPTQFKTKNARISRQTGEYVVREVIMKTEAYQTHIHQWDADVRMREAFDMQLLNLVDRKAYYNLWYVTFGASYGDASSRTGVKEKFTTVFAIKESDDSSVFETNIINVIASKSEIVPHVNL